MHFSLVPLVLGFIPSIIASRHTSPVAVQALREKHLQSRASIVNNVTSSQQLPSYYLPTKPLINFKSDKAKEFYVDGKKIPYVDWDVGPSYAGLLPISNKKGETKKLFFWFYPAVSQRGVGDLSFWTNGGPGCSSMESLLQETGPISWRPGQARPVQNPESWTNASSMLYVEQPIGTGYTEGTPTAKNETDVAADVFGFFQQWLEVFPEMKGKNFLVDWRIICRSVIQEEIPIVPLVQRYERIFAFNQTFMEKITTLHETCGYKSYLETYLATPPPQAPFPIPAVGTYDTAPYNDTCDIFSMVYEAALQVNPSFDIYHVMDTPPTLWSVLGFPGQAELFPGQTGDPVYFNRSEVKTALHVPQSASWSVCSEIDVFPHGDDSVPSALSVLPGVIEKSQRTVIAHGLADMVLISEGTRLAIQNMTWSGEQGFQKAIDSQFIVEKQGFLGVHHTERNLTYVEVELSGHQIPQYQPQAALQMFQYLLGQRSSPSL